MRPKNKIGERDILGAMEIQRGESDRSSVLNAADGLSKMKIEN